MIYRPEGVRWMVSWVVKTSILLLASMRFSFLERCIDDYSVREDRYNEA